MASTRPRAYGCMPGQGPPSNALRAAFTALIDVLVTGLGDRGPGLAGCGVDRFECFAFSSIDELPGDE
ncbi:MAG: hypothetical protein R2849_09375 [Thermomicrobiales bacterium]